MRRKNYDSQLRAWLLSGDRAAIQTFARTHRRALSYLTALTYDPYPCVSWRAIEGLGLAAGEIGAQHPEYVLVHLRRLVWLLTDESGGIGWRAPEAMGAIIATRPPAYAAFIPILVSILDMEAEDVVRFRAGALWAIGHLAPHAPEYFAGAENWLPHYFNNPDSQVRGMAAWAYSRCMPGATLEQYPALLTDPGEVVYLHNGNILQTTVAASIRTAITTR